MTTRIIGTGSYLPETIVNNNDLAVIVDTSDEWIRSRTGICSRRLVKDENTTFMCVEAAKKALDDAGMKAQELDLILVGTITGDHLTPSAACEVQAGIGAVNAAAFDINAACSGFLFALHTAHAYIRAGIYENALIIGAETLSKIIDWQDRSTCVLFGDGAGAAVVRGEETGLLFFDQCSDGSKGHVLTCKDRPNHNPLVENAVESSIDNSKNNSIDNSKNNSMELGYVRMDGQEVYKFAVTNVPKSIQKVLSMAGLKAEDVDCYALHQANIRIIQAVAKRLGLSMERFPSNLDHCGNISAASVPILLDEINRGGLLKRGDKVILSGFGGGFTWGTALFEW